MATVRSLKSVLDNIASTRNLAGNQELTQYGLFVEEEVIQSKRKI